MEITRRDFLKTGAQLAAAAGLAGIGGHGARASENAAASQPGAAPNAAALITDTSKSPSAKLFPLGVNQVRFSDTFWSPKLAVNHKVSIPHQWAECERTQRIDNFRDASGVKNCGGHHGRIYDDSDVYKWAEAVAWQISREPDADLQKTLDEFIGLVAGSQQKDGYLNTAFMGAQKYFRWTNLAYNHELYCGGHLVQAAVAHYRATGGGEFLDVAQKWADHISRRFSPRANGGAPGHPEVEMALVELYRATGTRKYLDTASFFIDQRGSKTSGCLHNAYIQDDKPFREQPEVSGHAVRQLYLCSGAADVFAETGDDSLMKELVRMWDNFTQKKMYISGGAGARYDGETFGANYELPNRTAYAETCAAIASFMWNWRMLNLTAESKYADIMEQTLYNGLISGVALDGKNYFYTNPLEHNGINITNGQTGLNWRTSKHWDGTACCPPNVARLLASLPGYFYSRSKDALYVNLYGANEAEAEIGGAKVKISQKTDYPWDGRIEMSVAPAQPAKFSVMLRIPGWCKNASVAVNGSKTAATAKPGEYLALAREWRAGDKISIDFPMEAHMMRSNPAVYENEGHVALMRGPILFCIEQADFPDTDIFSVRLPESAKLTFEYKKDLLGGVGVLKGDSQIIVPQGALYSDRDISSARKSAPFTAIPYFSWANRTPGTMRIWLPV